MTGSGSYPYTQDSSPVIMVFMNSGSLFVESSKSCESWVYGYDPEPVIWTETIIFSEHVITFGFVDLGIFEIRIVRRTLGPIG